MATVETPKASSSKAAETVSTAKTAEAARATKPATMKSGAAAVKPASAVKATPSVKSTALRETGLGNAGGEDAKRGTKKKSEVDATHFSPP